jgi:RNA polymerase sigma-70 factor (ECF subfamily)
VAADLQSAGSANYKFAATKADSASHKVAATTAANTDAFRCNREELIALGTGGTGAGMDTATTTAWQPGARLSPESPSDQQLLAAHARGERGALEELFRRHRAAAYRVAYRRLGQEADALDAVQEGFIKAFRNLGSLRKGASFKTWLLRIIMNVAIDLRRVRDRWRVAGLDSARGRGPDRDGPGGVGQGMEEAELRRLLDEALAALPEAHRKTFILHADADLAYREVAEVLGVPIGTVMSRLYYARRKLQAFLAPRMHALG